MQNKVLVLLANKIDLKKDRIFKEEDSRKFAEDSNMKYFEISVRNDDSKIIKHLVEEVAKEKGRKNEKEEEDLEIENEKEENVNEVENEIQRQKDNDGYGYPCYNF